MKKITGYDYEYCCARYLKTHGYRNVSVTQGSGDQGADIIARRHGHTVAVQCKYYHGPVGNKAIQEAYSGAAYYGCDRAMVITNSFFTDSAENLAASTGVELMEWMQPARRGTTLKKAPPPLPGKKRTLPVLLVFLILAVAAGLCYYFYYVKSGSPGLF